MIDMIDDRKEKIDYADTYIHTHMHTYRHTDICTSIYIYLAALLDVYVIDLVCENHTVLGKERKRSLANY